MEVWFNVGSDSRSVTWGNTWQRLSFSFIHIATWCRPKRQEKEPKWGLVEFFIIGFGMDLNQPFFLGLYSFSRISFPAVFHHETVVILSPGVSFLPYLIRITFGTDCCRRSWNNLSSGPSFGYPGFVPDLRQPVQFVVSNTQYYIIIFRLINNVFGFLLVETLRNHFM